MSSYTDTALKAATKAEKVLSKYFLKRTKAKRIGVEFKAEADMAADKVIYNTIHKAFPKHSILTEERAAEQKFGEYTWVIDPIDGTTNFICGFPMWAISIGLLYHGKPILAAINLPQLKKLYQAEEGKGTFCNNKKVQVSKTSNLMRTVIALDPGYHPHRRLVMTKVINKLGENIANITMINSVCTTFPLIASGNLQGMINYTVTPWELPTGKLIVEEAGGKVTDHKGKKIHYNINSQKAYEVVASNDKIHNRLIKLLN